MFQFLLTLFILSLILRIVNAFQVGRQQGQSIRENRCEAFVKFAQLMGAMAKVDGCASEVEVTLVQKFFQSICSTDTEYRACRDAFNRAVQSGADVQFAARDLVRLVTLEGRHLFYELLWRVAMADGVLSDSEDRLLQRLVIYLNISPELYAYYKRLHLGGGSSSGSANPDTRASSLAKAYAVLGCQETDSDDVLRAAYRKQAMRYHPDRLRAEGLSEKIAAKATQTMSEINAAWETIKSARGIK